MTAPPRTRIEGAREFLNTSGGKIVGICFILLCIGAVLYAIKNTFGASETEKFTNTRTFVCSETLKPYQYELKPGTRFPAPSPFSGKNTGYPAELCYWTKDGKIKQEPTAVLLNSWRKLPEPTFCPDCGRMVVPRNPKPAPGAKPPPTEAEFKANPRSRVAPQE
jgi:hypothetical protein